MRIFVIPSCYKNSLNMQANIFVHEQCEELIKRGHQVIVLDATTLSYKNWNHISCEGIFARHEGKVKVYSYYVRGLLQSKIPRLATLQFRNKINLLWDYAIKQEGMPDIIYSHFSFPSGYCSVELSQKYNIPLVTMEHGGIYLNKKVHSVLIKQLTQTVNFSNHFLSVSSVHAKRIRELTGTDKRIDVIPNMISDSFKFCPLEQDKNFVFFSAGNLKKVKRFDLLISAFCASFNPDQPVILRIAGEGDEREKLERMIKENGREKQIILLGRLDRAEMLSEYKKSNCFVLASVHESFGIVYREAMACGRPIVSTDNGGISEGWDDCSGRIVPLDNAKALSDALSFMWNNYSQFNLEEISRRTLDFCSSIIVMDKVESVLKNEVFK